jgi:Fur family ferric uptake transcriptional regulator
MAGRHEPPGRRTVQREAIRGVFQRTDRPLGIAETLARAREAVPSLDQATVYRTLNRLVSEGWLLRICHPDAGTLHERAGMPHHHHFFCRRCHQLSELPGCPLPASLETPSGYVTEGHEVYLHGVCGRCALAPL